LQRRLAAGDAVVLVDVRQPEEFTAPPGHLPGAVNVPLADLSGGAGELAARREPVVLVCKTDRRSARAATELLAAGLRDVTVLRALRGDLAATAAFPGRELDHGSPRNPPVREPRNRVVQVRRFGGPDGPGGGRHSPAESGAGRGASPHARLGSGVHRRGDPAPPLPANDAPPAAVQ
jgi:rhodanese-related sulfurtransferase